MEKKIENVIKKQSYQQVIHNSWITLRKPLYPQLNGDKEKYIQIALKMVFFA